MPLQEGNIRFDGAIRATAESTAKGIIDVVRDSASELGPYRDGVDEIPPLVITLNGDHCAECHFRKSDNKIIAYVNGSNSAKKEVLRLLINALGETQEPVYVNNNLKVMWNRDEVDAKLIREGYKSTRQGRQLEC